MVIGGDQSKLNRKLRIMQTKRIRRAAAVAFLLVCSCLMNSQAQTAGTLNFTINPVSHSGNYGAKHLVAIWLENSSGTFIKTKLKRANGDLDHLATWTTKSAKSVVDAVTGSTLTSYTPIAVTWNGTNVSNAVVADGDYKIWLEMAWDDSKTTGKTVSSYTFTKGAAAIHLTPANTSLFTSVMIDWVPATTGTGNLQSNDVRVFPNPTNGLLNIDLKSVQSGCKIQVINPAGSILFEENVEKGASGVKTLDLSNYSKGIYLVNISNANQKDHLQYKVILDK
jgi:hypothetical protein